MDDKYLFFPFVSLTSDIQHKTPSEVTDPVKYVHGYQTVGDLLTALQRTSLNPLLFFSTKAAIQDFNTIFGTMKLLFNLTLLVFAALSSAASTSQTTMVDVKYSLCKTLEPEKDHSYDCLECNGKVYCEEDEASIAVLETAIAKMDSEIVLMKSIQAKLTLLSELCGCEMEL